MAELHAVFYDPAKTFDENFDHGPFPAEQSTPYINKGEPKFKFLGHSLYSPFGIPAGPCPTSRHVAYAFSQGFDVVCYKTQRSLAIESNAFPNVLYLDVDGDLTLEKAAKPIIGRTTTDKPADQLTITNSFGNPYRGPEFWVEDLKKALAAQGPGQLLIMSVVGTIKLGATAEDYYEDFANTANLAVKAGTKVIELNLSCPNVANEGVLCYTPEAVLSICKKTKAVIGNIPIVAKMGYFSTEQEGLLNKIIMDIKPYVAAISAINTIAAPVVDEQGNQALPGPNRLKSGACGRGVKWAGLDMVKRLAAIREAKGLDFEIIGVGGVMNAKDFKDYIAAGANVVQSATGAIWNPQLAAEIKASL